MFDLVRRNRHSAETRGGRRLTALRRQRDRPPTVRRGISVRIAVDADAGVARRAGARDRVTLASRIGGLIDTEIEFAAGPNGRPSSRRRRPLGKATRCRDVDPFGCTRLTTHSTRSGTPLGRVQSASSGTSAKSPKPRPSRADGGPSLMTPLVEARSIRSTRRASGHRCKRPSQHPATRELSCSCVRRTRGPACSSWPIPVPTRRQRPPDKSPGRHAR